MEISTSSSSSQALAAYAAQQPQATPRVREREPNEEPNRSQPNRRTDNVNFSSEALRLSNQTTQDSRTTVNRADASEATRQQNVAPEVQRAEAAKSVAQAINAYRTTSII